MTRTVRLGDHLDFSAGGAPPPRIPHERFPVYGANGVIGYTSECNARGPLIVIGRVGSYCGSLRYCERDVWVTDNALVCRADNPEETRYWYYALQTCGLNRYRAGSGQPLLNLSILRSVTVSDISSERRRIGEILGALDDKIMANNHVIAAAEALMVAMVARISDRTALSTLASRSAVCLEPARFDRRVAYYSFPAYDNGARPIIVDGSSIKSNKFRISAGCVLFSKMNPRIPRIWNVAELPSEMALASTEFVVLQPIGVDPCALWSALRQRDVLATLQQRGAGMTGSRQRIQPRELLGTQVPDVRSLDAGTAQTLRGLGALCRHRRAESGRLSALRDELLPLLLTGKVRLTDSAAVVNPTG
ncbi:restriction endonuclease subunit S [Mycobacterium angelicum]|uniref:Restriction endonuclease subunit S n=1 Tax=Mycobacterium angelicum TaxID=470074 RepID=A0A1X0A5B9_MYCAN|nr:restriction endonuclease subunit S [Mycobacterium angelicum]ORA25250.1 restriction endonuclease subunit S [Mycobacterium angelicum]